MSEDARRATHAPTGSGVLFAEVAVVVMALIWGVNYSVIKYGTGVVPPLAYNAVRVLIGAVALCAIAALWGGAWPSRRDVLALLALGALGNGLYQVLFAEGISRTRAGEAALVVGASPALMALIGRMRGVERVTRRGVFGIALSIFGVALIVLGRAASHDSAPGGSLVGDLLVLAGSVCWAIYTIWLIPYTTRINGFHIVAICMVGGSVVLLVAGAREMIAVDWSAVPGAAWAAILYGGLGALVVAYILWYRGVKVLGPTRTALYGNLQPLIALLVAWIALHEQPTLWQLVGAATIVGGVLLTRVQASEPS
jgi:drug/metabolite transporter (DMT)-like permease